MSRLLLQKSKQYTVPIYGALCFGLSMMAFSSQAADVSFTATFTTPTCAVSAPATIDFGDVGTGSIKYGASLSNPQPLLITLSGCTGWLTSAQKPGIRVSGTGNTQSGDFLFIQSATSTAVNYGVLIKSVFDSNVLSDNSFIPIMGEGSGSAGTLPSDGTSIALNAALSCGTKCNDPVTQAGLLNAAVTFSFAYE